MKTVRGFEEVLDDNKRIAYQQRADQLIEEWNAEISDLKRRVTKVKNESQVEYINQLEKIRAKQETVKEKTRELKQAGQEAWLDFKHAFEDAWFSFELALKSFKRDFDL